MKEKTVVVEVPENEFGIFAVHGRAVENGGINKNNIGEIMEKLAPVLKSVQGVLAEDRGKVINLDPPTDEYPAVYSPKREI